MTEEQKAEEIMKNYLVGKDLINQYPMYRYRDIDINGFFGFSLFPSDIGKAGEMIFLAGDNIVVRGGSRDDFKFLMAKLIVSGIPVSMEKFAILYSRLFLMRRSVLLDRKTDIYFAERETFFSNQFSDPQYQQNGQGIKFSCWMLDTDRFEPYRINGNISLAGGIKS